MLIGSGLIANAFDIYKDNPNFIIFASGVSNSQNTDLALFDREECLLRDSLTKTDNALFIYFSTCSIYDNSLIDSPYVKHKIGMEKIIVNSGVDYLILRISNLIGFTDNPHTIINYFYNNIITETPFCIWSKAARNLIDIDDLYILVSRILEQNLFRNNIINIANLHNYRVLAIVLTLELLLQKKAIYSIEDKGGSPCIDLDTILNLYNECNITFNDTYLLNTIKKYYGA